VGVLLSNSLSSVTSLHAQILASEGTDTSFEVAAFSELMTIGNALASWPMRLATVVVGLVRVPPNFLQLWMNLILFPSTTSKILSGSSVMALILSIFDFSIAIAPMNAPKYLFADSASFVVRRCACQLLLSACQLTFGMFTFTFDELESSSQRSIRFGMREAKN
jgi:hypothetical protein